MSVAAAEPHRRPVPVDHLMDMTAGRCLSPFAAQLMVDLRHRAVVNYTKPVIDGVSVFGKRPLDTMFIADILPANPLTTDLPHGPPIGPC